MLRLRETATRKNLSIVQLTGTKPWALMRDGTMLAVFATLRALTDRLEREPDAVERRRSY